MMLLMGMKTNLMKNPRCGYFKIFINNDLGIWLSHYYDIMKDIFESAQDVLVHNFNIILIINNPSTFVFKINDNKIVNPLRGYNA